MNLLALEFSSSRRSAAVFEYDHSGGKGGGLLSLKADEDFRKASGLVLIDEALRKAKLNPGEIHKIAVGLGPGSYTGIRSAIAIAQGWQLARGLDLIGVGTFDVIATGAKKAKLSGEVAIVVDAQRNELYLARYNLDLEKPTVVEPLRLVPVSAVSGTAQVIGPDARKFVPAALDLFPSADLLAEVALLSGHVSPGAKLEPIYLRETSFVKASSTGNLSTIWPKER